MTACRRAFLQKGGAAFLGAAMGGPVAGAGDTRTTAADPSGTQRRFPITDFGAVPGGQIDARAAFTRAMDAASAQGGGVVVIPVGVFLINSFESSYYTVRPRSRVSVIGAGPQSIIRIGDRLRSATQGITFLYDHTQAVAHCLYADFTVDWNGGNNVQPHPATTMAGVNRMGGSGGQWDVHFRNMRFVNAGGNHSIYLSGRSAPNNPNGNCSVSGCSFVNAGQAIPGNDANLDHSSVYLDVPDSQVLMNVFTMDNLRDRTSTAIETHQDGAVVRGNRVHGFDVGINIGADTVSASRIDVSGNTLQQVGRGVQLWNASEFLLRDVSIRANTIGVRELEHNTPFGIVASPATMAGRANGDGLHIVGNHIRLLTQGLHARTDLLPCAISLHRWDQVTVRGNTLENWVAEAVLVLAETGSRRLQAYRIEDNTMDDCGTTRVPARKRVIAFNAGTQAGRDAISDVRIQRNRIRCGASAGTPALQGVYFNSGIFDAVQVLDNHIEGATRAPVFKGADCLPGQVFLVRGSGPFSPQGLIRATGGSEWTDTATGTLYRVPEGPAQGGLTGWQMAR